MPQFRLRSFQPKIRENDVEKSCIQILQLRGYKVLRLPVGLFKTLDGRYHPVGEAGLPDYVALKGCAQPLFVEVKRPGGKLSPAQEAKIAELRQAYNLLVAVVDSPEALAEWLGLHI